MKLYVGNLNYSTTSEGLESLFSNFGTVSDVTIITDRETGRSRGFAFVTFEDEAAARKAIDEVHGTEFEDRELTVNEARPKVDRPRGGGGGGGGYDNRQSS
jgi:cold-inducible RNA-binding protein